MLTDANIDNYDQRRGKYTNTIRKCYKVNVPKISTQFSTQPERVCKFVYMVVATVLTVDQKQNMLEIHHIYFDCKFNYSFTIIVALPPMKY